MGRGVGVGWRGYGEAVGPLSVLGVGVRGRGVAARGWGKG